MISGLTHTVKTTGVLEGTVWEGTSAGCLSTLGINPFNVVKQIITNEGFAGLYAGVIPRSSRVVPEQGIIFVSFDMIQTSLFCGVLYKRNTCALYKLHGASLDRGVRSMLCLHVFDFEKKL